MPQRSGIYVLLGSAALLALSGCATAPTEDGGAAADAGQADGAAQAEAGEEAPGAEARGMAGEEDAEAAALAEQEKDKVTKPDQGRVFFAFDSAELTEEARATLRAHAEYIQSLDGTEVTLEGHADERGSREYNLGLGERRAKSARRILLVHGVDSSRLEIISYGEERPLVDGHTEEAYSKNRRVEIRYEE